MANAASKTLFSGTRAWWAMLALVPMLNVLPAVPIDETRYLTVAWEMRQTGDWIALHLNGLPYFDKPPLLFWLINLSWKVFGVSVWSARLINVLLSCLCLAAMSRLDRLLDCGLYATAWILAGTFYFAMFSGVDMFDVGLCCFVVLGYVALVTRAQGTQGSALGLLFAAVTFGALQKGPVILVYLAGPILLMPWWLPETRARGMRWHATHLAVALAGLLPAVVWALLAARSDSGLETLLIKQTAGRMVQSFAHRRAWWWYLPLLPLLVLPWPLVLRWKRVAAAWRQAARATAWRFGLVAVLPGVALLSLISGKQVHYLIPLLPGVALMLAALLRRDAQVLSVSRLMLVWLLAVAVAIYAFRADGAGGWRAVSCAAWGYAGLCLAVCVALWQQRHWSAPLRAGLIAILMTVSAWPAMHALVLKDYDLAPFADALAQRVAHGDVIAREPNEPGLVGFLARLPQPLPTAEDPAAWAKAHPDGFLLRWSRHKDKPSGMVLFTDVGKIGWVGLAPARTIGDWQNSDDDATSSD